MKPIVAALSWLVAGIMAAAMPTFEQRVWQSIEIIGSVTPPPRHDPWYSAYSGLLEESSPGDILKMRELTFMPAKIGNASRAFQILYASTDSRYQATFGVTTLLAPFEKTTKSNQLLSYQVATDSADLNASPSFALQTGGVLGMDDITSALGRGWWVNVPDYEGPKASFTAGVQSGHSTIDSIRAVLDSDLGLADDTRYALWGYSGGALASEWAAELQVQYAPEMSFAGAALGGLTPNIMQVLDKVSGTYAAGLIPAGILGLSSQWPKLRKYVQSQLNPSGEFNRTAFNAAHNYTLVKAISAFINQDITKYFKNGHTSLEAPIAQQVIDMDGKMGYHGVPRFPIFAYQAVGDDISPIANTDKLIDRFCEDGANIVYHRNVVGDHQSESTLGNARAVTFLQEVLDGTYARKGCVILSVNYTTPWG